tara:strand:+ start:261 stop:773 length:513 start_codon:yes stop_codon:yes gene_type:complete
MKQTTNYIHKSKRKNTVFQYEEFTNTCFAPYLLPGKFETIEVEIEAKKRRTSYAMKTKLHPDAKMYIDFWGNENPYGIGCHQVFYTLCENDPGYGDKHRWVVTSGRHTIKDMQTHKFTKLEEAIKFMTREMIKTQRKFDKILGEKTEIWDIKKLNNEGIDINAIFSKGKE